MSKLQCMPRTEHMLHIWNCHLQNAIFTCLNVLNEILDETLYETLKTILHMSCLQDSPETIRHHDADFIIIASTAGGPHDILWGPPVMTKLALWQLLVLVLCYRNEIDFYQPIPHQGPQIHFTNGLSTHNPNLRHSYFSTWKIMIRAGHNFAHATTAELSWHVQKSDLVIYINSKL